MAAVPWFLTVKDIGIEAPSVAVVGAVAPLTINSTLLVELDPAPLVNVTAALATLCDESLCAWVLPLSAWTSK